MKVSVGLLLKISNITQKKNRITLHFGKRNTTNTLFQTYTQLWDCKTNFGILTFLLKREAEDLFKDSTFI